MGEAILRVWSSKVCDLFCFLHFAVSNFEIYKINLVILEPCRILYCKATLVQIDRCCSKTCEGRESMASHTVTSFFSVNLLKSKILWSFKSEIFVKIKYIIVVIQSKSLPTPKQGVYTDRQTGRQVDRTLWYW